MTKAAQWWIDNLPWRWSLGGVFIAIAFVGLTVLIFEPVVGDLVQYGLYVLSAVVPFAILGLAWGWQERRALRKAALRAADGLVRPGEYHFLQAGKGAACGLALGVVFAVASAGPDGNDIATDSVIPDDVAITAGFMGAGAMVGFMVGIVAGANLRRRLRAAEPAALT